MTMSSILLVGILATLTTTLSTASFGLDLALAQMSDNASMGNMTMDMGNMTSGNMTMDMGNTTDASGSISGVEDPFDEGGGTP
jgi:hypothetical protein